MIMIDYKDSRPIYEQIINKLQELMVLGVWEEDAQMPSVRSLALELSINPNTIQRAYTELERRGFIYSVKGKGSFVGNILKIREAKKQEISQSMQKLARDARNLGVTRAEFIECAASQYSEASPAQETAKMKVSPAHESGKNQEESGGIGYDTGSKPDETF